MQPGTSADARVLVQIVDRLRERFHIGRVCVVADRGMISAATIAALEERKLEYILGARERSSVIICRFMLEDKAPLTPPEAGGGRGKPIAETAASVLVRPTLTPHLSGAERRQLTVMFGDLVGSTPLSQRF